LSSSAERRPDLVFAVGHALDDQRGIDLTGRVGEHALRMLDDQRGALVGERERDRAAPEPLSLCSRGATISTSADRREMCGEVFNGRPIGNAPFP